MRDKDKKEDLGILLKWNMWKKILTNHNIMYSFLKTSVRGSTLCTAYANIQVPTSQYQSNNKYENFPPIMNDGRSILASWQPGAIINERIVQQNGIQSNWQYRKYLADHANEIRSQNFLAACTDAGYYDNSFQGPACGATYTPPILYSSINEAPKHRGSTQSDLKDLYLSKEQLQARKVIPSMTQAELVQQFGA